MTLAKFFSRALLGAALSAALAVPALAQGGFAGSGAQPVSRGATGRGALPQNNLIFGNGTDPVGFIAPGTNGRCLVDNGTIWTPGYCVTASGAPVSTAGTSVANPGTGTLEALLPIQTMTGAGKTFATADLFKETRRSNSGSAMTDTFPAAAAAGLVNGTKIVITNVDAAASDTISAGAGTTIGGSGVVGPGRSVQYVYDLANTTWRPTLNTGTALLGPNNLSDLASVAAARANLQLGNVATQNVGTGLANSGGNLNLQPASAGIIGGVRSLTCSSSNWLNTISTSGLPACAQPSFSDLVGTLGAGQLNVTSPLSFSGGTLALGTVPVPSGGTGAASFTAGLPLLGNGTSPLIQGTKTGSTNAFATSTGALTANDCVKIDASGNLVDAGATCGANANTPYVQDFLGGVGFTAGTSTSITLMNSPSASALLSITFDGVVQSHNTWSLSGAIVTFSAAIPANTQVVEAHWYAPSTTAGVGNLNALSGALNIVGQDISVAAAGTTITIAANLVSAMTSLRALAPGAYTAVYLSGYYGVGTGGFGYFYWDSVSTAADNGGSIIIPNAGGTGRWKRIQFGRPTYTPEDFGAKAIGVGLSDFDDAAPIRAAMSALNSAGGGTLGPSCHSSYNLASIGSNNALINNYSSVNIIGCGRSSTFRVANGMNASSSSFVFGIYQPGATSGTAVNDASYASFTIDMNGQNNSCSGTCWAYNVALGANYAQNVHVQFVNIINNAGSQGIAFGTNSAIPTASDIFITDNYFASACDYINAACTDHSAIWVRATSGTVDRNIMENVGSNFATGIELHGSGVLANNNVVKGAHKCMIVAADTYLGTPLDTTSMVASGNSCTNVNLGIDVWAVNTTTVKQIVLTANVIKLNTTSFLAGIDAYTHVGSALAGGLTIANNVIGSDLIGRVTNLFYGVLFGYWQSALISGNTIYDISGTGIIAPDNVVGGVSVYTVTSNIVRDAGRNTGTPGVSVGILFGGTATAGIINVQTNSIKNSSTAYMTTAVFGAMNSDGGLVANNTTSAVAAPLNWTGTGVTVGQSCSGAPSGSFSTLNGVVGHC